MKFYSLQEAVDILILIDHTMNTSKLIREAASGALYLIIPLNLNSPRHSPTTYARLDLALSWVINKLEKGMHEENLGFFSGDSMHLIGSKAKSDYFFNKKSPDATVQFDSAQIKFLYQLNDEVLTRFESSVNITNKIRELIALDGKAYGLIEKMSNVYIQGFYRVLHANYLDFDTKGESYIECVGSLDGKDLYYPFVDATSNMLRITADELCRYKATLSPTTPSTTESIPDIDQNQQESKKKNELNQVWQKKLEAMAADLIKSGKKSLATKGSLARKLARETGEDPATIERNTRKTW